MSLPSLRLFLSLLFLHLLFYDASGLLGCDLFKHVLDLENSLVEDGFVYFTEKCAIPYHTLGEFYVRNSVAAEPFSHVAYQNERLILNFIVRFCLGKQHLNDGLNGRQREGGDLQPLNKVVN